MVITTESVDLRVDGSPMRTFVAAPKAAGRVPGILLYSDIFQLTGPTLRAPLEGKLSPGIVVPR